eukprot:756237-Hanusia_phi.AAC.1
MEREGEKAWRGRGATSVGRGGGCVPKCIWVQCMCSVYHPGGAVAGRRSLRPWNPTEEEREEETRSAR